MRHLALFLLVIWTLGAVSCDDDSNNSNNINNTNNTNCDCQVTIDTINGRDLMTVNNLIQDQDDQDVNTAGFQIEVAVSFSQTAPCVPEDGSTARLSGGVETMQATITNGQAVFSGYSIPSGNGVLQLIASAGGCSSEPTDILLSTTPVPICAIVSGVTSGTSYSCENDDEVPGQLGLQRLITAQCSNVAQGTTVNFLVDGNMQASGVTGVTGQVSAQVTFPVTAICKDTVIVSLSGEYDGATLEDAIATGEACCLGAIPCSMGWIEGTHFVTGTPAGVDTMNVATDMESTTADHQNQYQITTNRSEVSSIALMADDGSGTFTQVCGSTSLTANTVTLDCTIPDGTVAIKPVCTITGETTPFEDASQHHTVYVDTIPPTYASDFSCNVSNAHEVDISCAWTIPGTAGTGEEIFGTIVRYTDTYDSTATCLADSFGLFDTGWSTLDDAPGLSTLDGAGIPGEAKNHTFTPFSPGPGYCMGEKLMDFGGNLSQGTGVSWTGAVYPTMQTIPGYSDDSQYGSALATVDLNCDGLKDLVVGAPIGHYDAACGGDGFCEGDGKVFAYFAKSTGGYSSTPDIVMTHDPDLGYDTYFNFGIAMAGIGNFSRHTAIGNDSPACEDLAVSALYMLNEDFYYTGEVYILKGRPDWTGFGQISTKTDDATSFDMVIKYRRGASDYSDNYYFYEEFGISLAAIGDFNGDGFGDMAIGAPGAMPSGAVYGLFSRPIPFKAGTNPPVYLEAPAQMSFSLLGNSTLSATVAPYVSDYEFLGWSMSALGDYNGDGYDDMLVGAPGCGGLWGYGTWGGTTNAPGKAFIILGGTGDSTTFDSVTYSGTRLFTLTQDTATIPGTSCFGWKVAGFGDINDDGLLDFGVSDRNYDMPGSSGVGNFEGALFVYFGDGTVGDLQTSDAGMKMRSENELTVSSDNFGVAVARSVETVNTPMGDFNNDGIPDILVGAQHFDTYHGSTFVWYGDVTLVPNYQPDNWITYEEATFWFTPPSPNGYWGVTTIWLGDSNNDGYSDIAIGDPVWDTFYSGGGSNPNRGRVTIIY